jgi:hypothetical protein
MTDRTYYKIMNWLGWSVIALGLIEVVLYLTGAYPEFTWRRLDLPMFATNLLVMVRLMKVKDEIIEDQDRIIDTLRK